MLESEEAFLLGRIEITTNQFKSQTRKAGVNRTQTAYRIREQIDHFLGIVYPHFSKPICKFLQQMLFGIQSSGDIKLSNIGRALDESIPLKKTEERLSRNLKTKDLDKKLNVLIAQEAASQITSKSLIIVDPTDIRKEYAQKMPFLARIRDGSRKELANGYSGCMAVACRPGERTMIPLHLRIWSSEAPDFVSENHQILEVIRTISEASERRGVYVIDRGGDREKLIHPLLNQGNQFIIRLVGNRHLTFGNREFLAESIAEGCETRHLEHIVKETREGEKTYKLEFGMRQVRMPGRSELLTLVVVHGFGEKPLMLLTNCKVTLSRKSLWRIVESYLSRWLIEEAIRFAKQSYNLEDIRLLDWDRLKNMMGILLLSLYFLGVHLGGKLRLQILSGHIVSAAKRFYGVSEFFYYALADGVSSLLSRIAPKQSPPDPQISPQTILPGFS